MEGAEGATRVGETHEGHALRPIWSRPRLGGQPCLSRVELWSEPRMNVCPEPGRSPTQPHTEPWELAADALETASNM